MFGADCYFKSCHIISDTRLSTALAGTFFLMISFYLNLFFLMTFYSTGIPKIGVSLLFPWYCFVIIKFVVSTIMI